MATSSTAAALQILNLSISRPYQPPRLFTCLPLPRGQGVLAVKTTAIRSSWLPTRGSRGTGLLERPMLEQSQFDPLPQPEQGGNMGQLRDKIGLRNGDSYKVLLIDDARHSEKLVEKALPQVVPSVTVADATLLFHESREKGAAVVIVTVKEHAEFYAEMMINNGLQSAIEPDE